VGDAAKADTAIATATNEVMILRIFV
jgi:hypothetical protein